MQPLLSGGSAFDSPCDRNQAIRSYSQVPSVYHSPLSSTISLDGLPTPPSISSGEDPTVSVSSSVGLRFSFLVAQMYEKTHHCWKDNPYHHLCWEWQRLPVSQSDESDMLVHVFCIPWH